MTIREVYTLVGGSYDDMSERFPSDALILRFLTMLPQDGSMELLVRSMDTADAKTAFRAVHTLKGVALNLGLTALAGVCSEMTEALRGSDTLPASAPALFEAVQREYDKVNGALVFFYGVWYCVIRLILDFLRVDGLLSTKIACVIVIPTFTALGIWYYLHGLKKLDHDKAALEVEEMLASDD